MEATWHNILNFVNSQFGTLDWGLLLKQLTYDENSPLIFSSGMFLCMFSVFIVIYTLLSKRSMLRTIFVLAFSYYFYYKSSGIYFFLLAVVTCSDYLIADIIYTTRSKLGRKCLVALSLLIDLGLLAYFKYTNFFGQLWSDISGAPWHNFEIFLPVGISFFTFQSLSYTIDVYRRKIEPVDNLLDYAFFVSFFPQLVAGPIVRASDFIPQMYKPLHVTREMLGLGFWFVVIGLFKKAVISDYISINFVERVFENPIQFSGIENLLGAYGYGLQIYCDFSGYSDMAIGLALLLGFRFNINFNNPYKAVSVTDFWRRWHISLSSWLKDYLYISLGGNRKGKIRQYLNLLIYGKHFKRLLVEQCPAQFIDGRQNDLVAKRRKITVRGLKSHFCLGRIPVKIIQPLGCFETVLNSFDIHIRFRKYVTVSRDNPIIRKGDTLTMKHPFEGPTGHIPNPDSVFFQRRVEKHIPGAPRILAGVRADISRHAIHLHIRIGPLRSFIGKLDYLHIHFVVP